MTQRFDSEKRRNGTEASDGSRVKFLTEDRALILNFR